MRTVILHAIFVWAALPFSAAGEDRAQLPKASEHTVGYSDVTGYILEKHADTPPVITVHFDHCIGSPLAREKRVVKGILVARNRVLAAADDFIDPCSPPMVLPEIAVQTHNHYFCHDQRIKKIAHLSLITEGKPEPDSRPEEYDARQRARLTAPRIIRVLNELNFDGTSTIDALLCHQTENGVINPRPTIAVLSLSQRGAVAIPADAATATIAEDNDHFGDDHPTSSALLLGNQMRFYNEETESEPDSSTITRLITSARQLQLIEERHGTSPQPVAFITCRNGKHHLKALVNGWVLIDKFPSLYDLPDYTQRHPYTSKLWKSTSPLTGTVSHALGMKSIPGMTGAAGGILATAEIASTLTVFYLAINYLSSSIPVYPLMTVTLGLVTANGFYRWVTSVY